jgi:two-component system sensor histidine kinase PilS (NtrC family)
MARLNPSLRKDVRQVVDLTAVPTLTGHRDKLKQALLNIVINAYQAMLDVVRRHIARKAAP